MLSQSNNSSGKNKSTGATISTPVVPSVFSFVNSVVDQIPNNLSMFPLGDNDVDLPFETLFYNTKMPIWSLKGFAYWPFQMGELSDSPLELDYLYRGDNRAPSEIFNNGFKAVGKKRDLISHLISGGNSAYVSTSKLIDVAIYKFPKVPLSKRTYVYVINPNKEGIDINQKFPEHGFLKEYEVAIPNQIEPVDIKGAWPVDVKKRILPYFDIYGNVDPNYMSTTIRKKHSIFLENPAYLEPSSSPGYLAPNYYEQRVRLVRLYLKRVGYGLAGLGIAIDSMSLYREFSISQANDHYDNTYQEAARIAGGWSGAMAAGWASGRASMVICAPILPPYGALVGGFVGGIVGSCYGYYHGGEITRISYNSLSYTPADSPESVQSMNPTKNPVRDRGNLAESIEDRIKPFVSLPTVEHVVGTETIFESVRPLFTERPDQVASIDPAPRAAQETSRIPQLLSSVASLAKSTLKVVGQAQLQQVTQDVYGTDSRSLLQADAARAALRSSVTALSPSLKLSPLAPAEIYHHLDQRTSVLNQNNVSSSTRNASTILERPNTNIQRLSCSPMIPSTIESLNISATPLQNLHPISSHNASAQQLFQDARPCAPTMPSALNSLGFFNSAPSSNQILPNTALVSRISHHQTVLPNQLSLLGYGNAPTMSSLAASFNSGHNPRAAQLFRNAEFNASSQNNLLTRRR